MMDVFYLATDGEPAESEDHTEGTVATTEEHAAEEASGLDLILPETAELVYGIIAFLVVLVAITKLAWPKMAATLDERAGEIQGKMEEADKALADANASKASFDARIADAKGEAARIHEEAKQSAEAMRRDIIAKAEAEAQAIVARAQAEVSAERDRALQELRGQVGALSVELASKIVEKEIDASAHQALVDTYIQRLSTAN